MLQNTAYAGYQDFKIEETNTMEKEIDMSASSDQHLDTNEAAPNFSVRESVPDLFTGPFNSGSNALKPKTAQNKSGRLLKKGMMPYGDNST